MLRPVEINGPNHGVKHIEQALDHYAKVRKFNSFGDLISGTKCQCTKETGGCDVSCQNRNMALECTKWNCTVGPECGNRVITHGKGAKVECFLTEDSGIGLRTLEQLKDGDFVIEYTGNRLVQGHGREVREEVATL